MASLEGMEHRSSGRELAKFTRTVSIALSGLLLIVAGVVYDMLFAGIPYQDPTPQMQASWDFHHDVAGMIYGAGALVFVLGLIASPLRRRKTGR